MPSGLTTWVAMAMQGIPLRISIDWRRKGPDSLSQSTLTVPSLPSLMTSLYPSQLGITTIFQMVPIFAPTLAEILKENNYHTGAIIAHLLKHTDIKKGFDSAIFVSPLDYAYTSDKVTKKAIDWIAQNRGRRFFLWLHYMDPH